MDEIFKNNLELITEQLKISNQFYLDQLKTKDDEIMDLREKLDKSREVSNKLIAENNTTMPSQSALYRENTELKKENKRLLDEYVYKPDKEKDDLVEQIKVNTNDLQLLEEIIKELKEKVKSYEDNVEEVGMTMIENLSEELGIKEERIMSCEKLCTQFRRDLGLYKRMWETLLMSYIIVSQSSDMPIYDEECCLMTHQEEIPYEDQERMIELIKYRIDNMNANDWNEDGGYCKLSMSSGDYGCGRRKFCNVMTRIEEDLSSDSDSDDSDSDSSDDEPFATPTPQGNSN